MIEHSKLINKLFSFGKSWKRLKGYEKRETSSHWSKRIFEKVKKKLYVAFENIKNNLL